MKEIKFRNLKTFTKFVKKYIDIENHSHNAFEDSETMVVVNDKNDVFSYGKNTHIFFCSQSKSKCNYGNIGIIYNSPLQIFTTSSRQELNEFIKQTSKKNEFKPFEKVLVRENNSQVWHCDFYAYTDSVHNIHYCVAHSGSQILPYKGNEHLVGLTDNPI